VRAYSAGNLPSLVFLRKRIARLFCYPGVKLAITQSDITEIEAKTIAIASRGIQRVETADRAHTFTDPEKLYNLKKKMESDLLDETHGGFFNVEMGRPS
jgi:hypothetical protein